MILRDDALAGLVPRQKPGAALIGGLHPTLDFFHPGLIGVVVARAVETRIERFGEFGTLCLIQLKGSGENTLLV